MFTFYEWLFIFAINIIFNRLFLFISDDQLNFNNLLERPKNYEFNREFLNKIKSSHKKYDLITCIHNFAIENDIYKKGVIVSLSGGVDSMVTLAILLFLQQTYDFKIYTATINYNLRKESKDEADFLKYYTSLFGIKNYISTVKEFSRKKEDSGKRSEFEEASRNLRFDTYKQIIEENNLASDCGVFVAHHQDDIIENIFTNLMKGGNILDLEVMKPISKIHNINIYRPLLGFKKQVIYDFAHEFDIPYFLDTTPKWSRRGKMRNEIFPLLDSVFSIDWHNKLKSIGTQSNDWNKYINDYIINPWFQEVKYNKSAIIIPIKDQPALIYSNIILKSLHNIGENMIKKTSVQKIMELINDKSTKFITLDAHRLAIIKNNNLIIFNSKKDKFISIFN